MISLKNIGGQHSFYSQHHSSSWVLVAPSIVTNEVWMWIDSLFSLLFPFHSIVSSKSSTSQSVRRSHKPTKPSQAAIALRPNFDCPMRWNVLFTNICNTFEKMSLKDRIWFIRIEKSKSIDGKWKRMRGCGWLVESIRRSFFVFEKKVEKIERGVPSELCWCRVIKFMVKTRTEVSRGWRSDSCNEWSSKIVNEAFSFYLLRMRI